MQPNSFLLPELKKQCLVFDIETSAEDKHGNEVHINAKNSAYIELAEVKFIGFYSYRHDKTYLLQPKKDGAAIRRLFTEHNILVGFNSEEFDYPICVNNRLLNPEARYVQVDCMQIMGKSNFKNKNGYPYKNRGSLMEYDFKNNKLKTYAEEMGLETQKGEIDYKIFRQKEWSAEELKEIYAYLESDILSVKQIFDKLWDFWQPFTTLLARNDILNLAWIRASIASLTYKAACNFMGVEPTYADKKGAKQEMGGYVQMPKYEEMRNVVYVDAAALYPNIFCMFNLLNENVSENKIGWHGNDMFQTKGYYLNNKEHLLNAHIKSMLKKRAELKKTDPKNPMGYTIKIFLNSLFGVVYSNVFEKLHRPNAGYDCCWLGQQIQECIRTMLLDMGFETIYADTDGLQIRALKDEYYNREYVTQCLQKVVDAIQANVPFPTDTFTIKIEDFVDYIMFPFTDQPVLDDDGNTTKQGRKIVRHRQGLKKNYVYIVGDKIKIMGLPIKKSNATKLGMMIYNDVLKPLILEKKRAKFSRQFIEETLNGYLGREDIIRTLAQEYKIRPAEKYKSAGQLQAQISRAYLNGGDGIVFMIKNNKIGKVGKGSKYCTLDEALAAKLTAADLDLEKVWHELEPFVEHTPLTNADCVV